MTIDSLRAVELVTADGRLVRASADDEPELFWGLRGAGANFGIVTSLEFDLHPFAGTLHRGVHIHPATDIHEVWATFRAFAASAPETIAAIFTVGLGEPAADYPDSVAGRPIIVISYNHSGDGEDVERDIAPLLKGPRPARVTATSEKYIDAQRSSDLSLAWGSRTFILGGYVADCSPSVLDAFVAHVEQVPGDATISVTALGGAIDRVPDDAMAFTGRAHPFDVSCRLGLVGRGPRRGQRDLGPGCDVDRRARSAAGPLHQRALRRRSGDHALELRRREAGATTRPQASLGPDERLPPEPQHHALGRLTLRGREASGDGVDAGW